MKIKTGIVGLDRILGGGFNSGSSILVIGDPRAGKSILAKQMCLATKKEDKSIYVATTDLGENILQDLAQIKKGVKNIMIIDAYSTTYGKHTGKINYIGKANLSDINVAVAEELRKLKKGTMRVVLDSLSNLILHNTLSEISDFLEEFVGKIRANGHVVFLLLENGMHEDKVVKLVESLTDQTILLKEEGTGKYLMLEGFDLKNPDLNQIPYELKEHKIKIK